EEGRESGGPFALPAERAGAGADHGRHSVVAMHGDGHVDSATLRGARIVGIVCAIAFFAPIVLSLVFPAGFFYRPYHPIYERMIGAILLALGLALLLALRDPARNAGVYAMAGLVTGSMAAAIVYALVLDGA